MRIAEVVPPWLPVPPVGYGGTEVVVHNLTEGLVKRGHQVTLFGSGDSQTAASLVPTFPKALGNDGNLKNNPFTLLTTVLPVFKLAGEFDIIHSHDIAQSLYLAQLIKTPVVHTLHGTVNPADANPDKNSVYQKFKSANYVSISNAQRKGLPELNYVATVYNGIDLKEFPIGTGKGKYLVWLGRITPKKGVVEAILTAKKVGLPIKIAAFIDPVEERFFDEQVKPHLGEGQVEFMGQLRDAERARLLGEAYACLFPIKWQEPFGLVMVEAMATGTPIIATNRGSVPEVVVDQVTGVVVQGNPTSDWHGIDELAVSQMTAAVQKIQAVGDTAYQTMRSACRRHVEDHFSVEKMVDGYEAVYRQLAGKS